MQRVLKLGEDNYTFDDLRRDMLIIEEEDKISKALQTIESRTITGQEDGTDMDRLWRIAYLADNIQTKSQTIIAEQIMKELEKEKKDEKEGK